MSDILRNNTSAQLTRAILNNKRPKQLHTHDFYELLWVQNGRVRHILPDTRNDLTENDMLFVRPAHRHALQGVGEAPLMVSIAFHPDLITQMAATFPTLQGHLFWANSDTPVKVRHDSQQLALINRAALQLEQSACTSLDAFAFLSPLCANLLPDDTVDQDAPQWLRDSICKARDPKVFALGAAGLVALTGKAHAHVSRTMRHYTGQTPAQYINTLRMTHAARALTGTSDPLPDIAIDIGIPNLSHFHKQFRDYHGQSPAKYRATHQRHVLQPE